MDVTCERCGTEYEFDETLVSSRGTTVKCTNCGYLFKVFRPEGDAASGAWSLRLQDGEVKALNSLKELQRMIRHGKATPENQIRRGDEPWKPLADIAELQPFFKRRADHLAQRGRGRTHTTPGVFAPTPPIETPSLTSSAAADSQPGDTNGHAQTEPPVREDQSAGAQARRERKPRGSSPSPRATKRTRAGNSTIPPALKPDAAPDTQRESSVQAPVDATKATADTAPARKKKKAAKKSGAGRKGATKQKAKRSRSERALKERARAETVGDMPDEPSLEALKDRKKRKASAPQDAKSGDATSTSAKKPSVRPLYLDNEEDAPRRRAKSQSGLWATIAIIATLAAGVALGWPSLMSIASPAPTETPIAPLLEQGDQLLEAHQADAYENALAQYERAEGLDDRAVEIQWRIARVQALWAQAILFRAQDFEAHHADEATRLRTQAQSHAAEALRHAEFAVRRGGPAEAEATLADALRLNGQLGRARSRLDRALTLQPEATAELSRIEALLIAAEEDDDLAAAIPRAENAVSEEPGNLRCRLLLARAYWADSQTDEAARQLDAILRRAPEHPDAMALRRLMLGEAPMPPQSAPPNVEDANAAEPTADESPAAAPNPDETTPSPASPNRRSERAIANARPSPNQRNANTSTARPERSPRAAVQGNTTVPEGRDYGWYVRQGDSSLERGDLNRARSLFERARDQRPSGSEMLTGLGYVNLESGRTAEAARLFRQAASQGYADAYIGLGSAYRRLGQRQNAIRAYERYLQRLPSGSRASLARQQIEALEEAQTTPAPSTSPSSEPSAAAPAAANTPSTPTPTETSSGQTSESATPSTPAATDELQPEAATDVSDREESSNVPEAETDSPPAPPAQDPNPSPVAEEPTSPPPPSASPAPPAPASPPPTSDNASGEPSTD